MHCLQRTHIMVCSLKPGSISGLHIPVKDAQNKKLWGDFKCSEGFIRYEDGVNRKIADKKRSCGSVMFIDSVTNVGGESCCNSEWQVCVRKPSICIRLGHVTEQSINAQNLLKLQSNNSKFFEVAQMLLGIFFPLYAQLFLCNEFCQVQLQQAIFCSTHLGSTQL